MIIAAGTYKAKAIKAEAGKSANKGTDQVSVLFNIESGPHAGQEITWIGYFTEKTADRTIDSLMICGWDGEDYTMFSGVSKNTVDIVVEHETYVHEASGEERTRARVAWVNDPNRVVGGKPMSAGELTDFAARMRGRVLAMKEKRAKGGDDSFNFGANAPKF